MKALEKDREHRYETANGLARDLQRYLADEVVEARSPGAGYRLRKFVKRNRGPVVAASLIVLLLLGGIVGTTVGLISARRQRDEAEKARLDEAREADRALAAEKLASTRLAQVEAEKQRADEERDVAQAVNDFVQKDLLGQGDPDNQPDGESPRDPDIKVRTVLDRAAKCIGARFANKPRVEAAIRLTLAEAYRALGNWPEARLHAERCVELRTANLGAAHADTLNSKRFLALVLHDLGEIQRAEAVLVDVVQQQTETLGPDHGDTQQSKVFLAYAYMMRVPPEPDRAEVLLRDVVQKRADLLGPNHEATLRGKISLAWAYKQQGKLDRAEAMYVELLDAFTGKFGADSPTTLHVRSNLGLVYVAQGQLDQAERHLQYVLQRSTSIYGEDNPKTVASKWFLARLYRRQRNYERSVRLYDEVLTKLRANPGFNEAKLFTLSELAQTHLEAKQPDKARPLIEEFTRGLDEHPVPESLRWAGGLAAIGLLLAKNEQYVEAEKHLRRSLDIREKEELEVWSTFDTQSVLGAALLGQEKYAEAEPLLLRGYEGMKQREDKIPAQHRSRLTKALERLVQLYNAWNKPDEAAKWRRELETIKKQVEKPAKPEDQ
jgi:tetratricopeptide (TPR) repeat protein